MLDQGTQTLPADSVVGGVQSSPRPFTPPFLHKKPPLARPASGSSDDTKKYTTTLTHTVVFVNYGAFFLAITVCEESRADQSP